MSKAYFENNLNYSYANEDSTVEETIVQTERSKRILTVCGSGSRTIPLINDTTEHIDIVDLSEFQLSWSKLFLASYEKLNFAEFKEFWGYDPITQTDRKKQFTELVQKVDERLLDIFNENEWSSPIYYGGWEQTYQKLSRIVRLFLGSKLIADLEDSKDISDQWKIFSSVSFQLRWKAVLFIVGNRALFNSLLYKGHFIKKNLPVGYVQFYINAFERLFKLTHIRDSFFLQFSFLGRLKYQEGAILSGKESIFDLCKQNLPAVKLNYIQQDIMKYLCLSGEKYDCIILSDVPSYFPDELGQDFLQKIKERVHKDGVVIIRYYLREYSPKIEGYEDITSKYQETIDNERVQMYSIKVYKRL